MLFLQNHDQIGNRAFGERLTTLADPQALEAAIALLLLSPADPAAVHGRGNRQPHALPVLHRPRPELAEAVREGRRSEFARFAAFADPAKRERIPDPNAAATFQASVPSPTREQGAARVALYRELIALRHARDRAARWTARAAWTRGASAPKPCWRAWTTGRRCAC